MTYYKTEDQTKARYIRDKLEQNHYNPEQIPQYKQQYTYNKQKYQQQYKNKYQTIDYYKNTNTRLTQTDNIK